MGGDSLSISSCSGGLLIFSSAVGELSGSKGQAVGMEIRNETQEQTYPTTGSPLPVPGHLVLSQCPQLVVTHCPPQSQLTLSLP